MMQCPACANELVSEVIDGIQLEVCDGGCGGIWFGRDVLTKFDHAHHPTEDFVSPRIRTDKPVDQTRRYICPHCNDIAMVRQFVKVLDDVLVDECSSCGGMWLHGDELAEIQHQFDEEGSLSASHEPIMDPDDDLNEREELRNRRFLNACRFLWIPHCVG